jgi:hypothetical protein
MAAARTMSSARETAAAPGGFVAGGGARMTHSAQHIDNLKDRIEEHMPIVGSDGVTIGTVDHLDQGNSIKLTKDKQGQHHWIPMDWVAWVDETVALDRAGDQARQEWGASPLRSIRRE